MARDIHFSVVSHNQGDMAKTLLDDLAALPAADRFQVTATLNTPEMTEYQSASLPFPIRIIENSSPKGFAANHNSAFNEAPILAERKYFVVINPDVRLFDETFLVLIDTLWRNPQLGVVGPTVRDREGNIEATAREIPTLSGLIYKAMGNKDRLERGAPFGPPSRPDWIAGMFMAFRAEHFESIDGFDESYHLYYEDVDICCRLWLAGLQVGLEPSAGIVHNAQRASHRDWNHFRWHLASIWHFLRSDTSRLARQFHRGRSGRGKMH